MNANFIAKLAELLDGKEDMRVSFSWKPSISAIVMQMLSAPPDAERYSMLRAFGMRDVIDARDVDSEAIFYIDDFIAKEAEAREVVAAGKQP